MEYNPWQIRNSEILSIYCVFNENMESVELIVIWNMI